MADEASHTGSRVSTRSARAGRRFPRSCLPCREQKTRCNHEAPCQACIRRSCQDRCLQNPPSTIHSARVRKMPLSPLPVSQPVVMRSPESFMASDAGNANSREIGIAPAPVGTRKNPARLGQYGIQSPLSPFASASEEHMEMGHIDPVAPRIMTAPPSSEFRVNESARQTSLLPFLPPEARNQDLGTKSSTKLAKICGSGIEGALTLDPMTEQIRWRFYLTSLLPTQSQCEVLVSYFIENVNYVYHAIHVPTFRAQCVYFWTQSASEIDLIWLSLLFIIICLASLRMPLEMCEVIELDSANLQRMAHLWYRASRQALQAGRYESKPCMTQLQAFIITQSYLHMVQDSETFNSFLGQAVRCAQALSLDKPSVEPNLLEREMRHRLWWEICHADTFQTLCLTRSPLIQSYLSNVPYPQNCNDVDLAETQINSSPRSQPTELSWNHCKANLFQIFNKLYKDAGVGLTDYDYVVSIDAELISFMANAPWYFQIGDARGSAELPRGFDYIPWQHLIFHTCVCVQRIRMYRPFLRERVGNAWSICVEAAESALQSYHMMRDSNPDRFFKSQKFRSGGFQIYSTAVALAMFLLVERPPTPDRIRQDIDMVIDGLGKMIENGNSLPINSGGRRVLLKILEMYDRCESGDVEHSSTLASAISSVFGGERTARKYLSRLSLPNPHAALPILAQQEQVSNEQCLMPLSQEGSSLGDQMNVMPSDRQDPAQLGFDGVFFEENVDMLNFDPDDWYLWSTIINGPRCEPELYTLMILKSTGVLESACAVNLMTTAHLCSPFNWRMSTLVQHDQLRKTLFVLNR